MSLIWATDAVAAGTDSPGIARAARALRRMDGLWVLSQPQVEAVRAWLGPSCPPVSFLRFGVDTSFYKHVPYPSGAPHVVSVGGDRDRDPTTLFAALAIVRHRRPDVSVTVQSPSSVPAPDGVRKISRLTHAQVANLLASATVVAIATVPNVHASGITVGLEAMSVGRPPVVCATSGMDDYFDDGVTALVVPPQDPDVMANAILELVEHPVRAAAMGEAATVSVHEQFTTSVMCEQIRRIVGMS